MWVFSIFLTLFIQDAVLFLNILDVLLVLTYFAAQRLNAFGGFLEYLCAAGL